MMGGNNSASDRRTGGPRGSRRARGTVEPVEDGGVVVGHMGKGVASQLSPGVEGERSGLA